MQSVCPALPWHTKQQTDWFAMVSHFRVCRLKAAGCMSCNHVPSRLDISILKSFAQMKHIQKLEICPGCTDGSQLDCWDRLPCQYLKR